MYSWLYSPKRKIFHPSSKKLKISKMKEVGETTGKIIEHSDFGQLISYNPWLIFESLQISFNLHAIEYLLFSLHILGSKMTSGNYWRYCQYMTFFGAAQVNFKMINVQQGENKISKSFVVLIQSYFQGNYSTLSQKIYLVVVRNFSFRRKYSSHACWQTWFESFCPVNLLLLSHPQA